MWDSMVSRSQYGQHQFESWGWPQFSGIDTGHHQHRERADPAHRRRGIRCRSRRRGRPRGTAPASSTTPIARTPTRTSGTSSSSARSRATRWWRPPTSAATTAGWSTPAGVRRRPCPRVDPATGRRLTAAERNQLRPWPHIDGTFTYSDDIGMSRVQRASAQGAAPLRRTISRAMCPTPGRGPRTRAAAGSASRTESAAAPGRAELLGHRLESGRSRATTFRTSLPGRPIWELPFGRGKRWLNEGMPLVVPRQLAAQLDAARALRLSRSRRRSAAIPPTSA